MKLLQPTKQKRNIPKFYGFDIETCNDNRDFVCASVWYSDTEKWFFTDKRQLIDFFKTKMFRNSYICATNNSFDFFGTFQGEPELLHFRTMMQGSNLLWAKTYIDSSNKKFYHTSDKRRHYLCFIDTYNYVHLSVEKMGKILGILKLEKPGFLGNRPQSVKDWSIMYEYNMRDAEVSCRFMRFLASSFIDLGASFRKTIASTSKTLFTNKYLTDKYYTHPTPILKDIFKSYYGGRTETFKRGKINNYNYYDINSLYPSVMLNSFPDPNSIRFSRKDSLEKIKEYEGVSEVDIISPNELPHPLLPYRTNKKLIFPLGNWSGSYSHVELRRALSLGYKITKVHKTYYFKKSCFPFKGYVQDLYAKRQEFKSQRNPMELVVKLMLNSLYGKFGEKFEDKDNFVPDNLTEKEINSYKKVENVNSFWRVVEDVEPASHCIPIWAVYVTAYARLKMYDYIIECDPVYMDTDSIITKRELPQSKELGLMKREMFITDGMIVKPKFYYVKGINEDGEEENNVKIKGIGKKVIMKEFDDYVMKKARGEDVSFSYIKFTKIKEAIRRGLPVNLLQEVTRNLSVEDEKRDWLGQTFDPTSLQNSLPLKVVDGILEKDILILQQKAKEKFDREKEKEIENFINSDLFDKQAVGKDISYNEYLENEKFIYD